MKKSFLIIAMLVASLVGCEDDHTYGPGEKSFMEKTETTLPAEGGEEVLKASTFFFSIQYLKSIQTGDTIKLDFGGIEAGEQTITGEWFKVETMGVDTEAYPTEIKVSVQANKSNAERQLIFGVWNGEREDTVTVIQNQD